MQLVEPAPEAKPAGHNTQPVANGTAICCVPAGQISQVAALVVDQ